MPKSIESPYGEADVTLQEALGRCSVRHRLSITVEGCVTAEKLNPDPDSISFTSGEILELSNPNAGLLTPPYSPVAKQCHIQRHSEPLLKREVLVCSSSSVTTLDTTVPQQEPKLNQAQSLPSDEIEILCAEDQHPVLPAGLPDRSGNVADPMHDGIDKRGLGHSRTLPDHVVVPLLAGGSEVRLRGSENKGVEEKEKKRSSLFSPRKSRKSLNAAETRWEPGKQKSLWKTVFSVYKKDKKRKDETMPADTAAANTESKRKVPSRTTGEILYIDGWTVM